MTRNGWMDEFVQVNIRLHQKIQIISLQWQKLSNLNTFPLPANFCVALTENIITEKNIHECQSTFCRSSCSFLSMASSCDTFSSRWPGESLQQREAVTLRQKQSQNFTVCNRKMHKWKPKYQNGLVSRSTNQQDKCIQWYLLRFIKRVFSSVLLEHSPSSHTEWTFQFAWLAVEPSVTVAASELKTSSLLPLMKPLILRDQFTVIATPDKQTHSEWV